MKIETPPIPFQQLYAISFIALFVILGPAWAAPPSSLEKNIAASQKKIRARVTDLHQLAPNLPESDHNIINFTAEAAEHPLCQLDHIQELLMIDSAGGIDDRAKTNVKNMINGHLEKLGAYVDLAVEFINRTIADLHNQTAVLAVSKLRDDLRELKDLPKSIPNTTGSH